MVVRAYAPSEAGFGPRPFQAAQCLEQRFTLDSSGHLIVDAKDEFHPRVKQIFHRVR
jgi:hypothetical protein